MNAESSSRSVGRTTRKVLPIGALLVILFVAGLVSSGCSAVGNMPAASGSTSTPSSTTPSAVSATGTSSQGALLLGVMVHLEGWRNEARDQQMFQQHAGLVRQYADIFEKYGLRLTFEASPEFTQGCIAWKDNVLKEMSDRGHGVGLHADLGAEPGLTQQAFVVRLVEMKREIESLGIEVRHVSGICSSLDWVTAAKDAGFEFVSGTVEYALKSIPADKLPAEYQDVLAVRNPSQAHGSVPHELSDRLHPWRMATGADWLWNSADGKVVMIAGDGGMCIPRMAEEESGAARAKKAEFNADDISAFTREVDEALGLVLNDKVNALYVGWSIGQRVDPVVVEEWAKAIKNYVDAGKVQWKTLPQMYDAFLAWESGV